MDALKKLLADASKQYNNGHPHEPLCRSVILHAHEKLTKNSKYAEYGKYAGTPSIAYNVFAIGENNSRPVRPDIFIIEQKEFVSLYNNLLKLLKSDSPSWSEGNIRMANSVIYTSIMSVACCYDLWQRGSRKTPGTFFEVFMAALLQPMLPDSVFSKHIPLLSLLAEDEKETRRTSRGVKRLHRLGYWATRERRWRGYSSKNYHS